MIKLLVECALFAAAIFPVVAQPFGNLPGVWREDDGKATVRIARCAAGGDLCATVIDEKLELGEPSRRGKITVTSIRQTSQGRWTGLLVDADASMTMRIRQTSPDTVSFKICALAFFCETKRYQRLRR
jgi:uncharacterized protein (DUF2147 family)